MKRIASFAFRLLIGATTVALTCLPLAVFAQDSPPESDQPTEREESERAPGEPRPVDAFWIAQVKPPTLENWQPLPPRRLEGEIIGFTGKELVVVGEAGEPVHHDQSRVVHVEPIWRNSDAKELHQLYLSGQYKDFAKKAPPIIQGKIPPWQQRLLLAELIDSAASVGNIVPAGKLFLSLVENNSPDMLYAVMPLCWVDVDLAPTVEKTAAEWFADERESAQLLGASWLLSGPKRSEAQKRLQSLAQNSKSAPIRTLATSQLWRIETIASAKSSDRTIAQWQEFRDRMSLPLQIGPTELIADRWVSLQRWDLAVGEAMRVVTLYPHRVGRADRSRNLIEQWLGRGGHPQEAAKIKRISESKE